MPAPKHAPRPSKPGEMPYLNIGRYEEKDQSAYAGYIEPEDKTWIIFIRRDNGKPILFPDRDPRTGAVLSLHGDVAPVAADAQ